MFANKNLVITGAATGIGAGTAKYFADLGCRVYNLDINAPSFQHALIETIHCDVTKFSDLDAAFKQIMAKEKTLHYLFANAGIHIAKVLDQTSLEEIDRMININLKGQIYALKCALPIMMKQAQGGRIVLMGSDTSKIGKADMALYGVTKAAIGSLAKSTAIDYAQYNIRINCICPGSIETDLLDHLMDVEAEQENKSRADIMKKLEDAQPVHTIGTVAEVAKTVAFLLSDDLPFLTGALLSLDGGYTAQ